MPEEREREREREREGAARARAEEEREGKNKTRQKGVGKGYCCNAEPQAQFRLATTGGNRVFPSVPSCPCGVYSLVRH